MLVRAFKQGSPIVCVTAAAAVLVPAGVASAGVPIAIDTPAATQLPAGPVAVAPPVAVLARSCPGARRAKRPAARRRAVACLVNKARAVTGLRGFRSSAVLARAAKRHARDMVRARYFAHQRAGGPSLTRRARRAGWRGRSIGEAIAYGCGSAGAPASIVRSWLNSPPHRAILLSQGLGRVGIGVVGRAPVSCGGRGATFVLDAAG
jgi:uncharacterized protein YkwD